MPNARWTDLTAAEYHADGAVSRSQLKTLMTLGAEEYCAAHITKEVQFAGSDSTVIGTLFHDIKLRGCEKEKMACKIPVTVLNKSGGRSGGNWEAFAADCEMAGVVPLLEKDWVALDRMLASFNNCVAAQKIMAAAEFKERTCEWEDQSTGILCRVMFDVYAKSFRADLKGTKKTVQPFTIADHIAKMGYHWQAAWYNRAAIELGGNDGPFYFLFTKFTPPYTTRCFTIPKEQVAIADAQISRHLLILRDLLDNDTWSSFDSAKPTEITLPRWIENLDKWTEFEGD